MEKPVLIKRILTILVIILFAFNITLLINSLRYKKLLLQYKQELVSVIEANEINKQVLINRELNTIRNIGLQINIKLKVEDEKGNKISIAELLNNNIKVIFRYSELNCSLCIEEEIQILHKYINNIGIENILFFSTYHSTRDLFLFKRINKLQNFKIYNLKEEQLNIPVDRLNIPYVLLVDSSGNIVMINIPEKTKPEFSEQFYNVVISRLASN
ncbi:MAG: hypothetical protein HQ543_10690 [Bacteroidetes bacterium]|nr:hypothetical protein [Bacteroidota bacterium]